MRSTRSISPARVEQRQYFELLWLILEICITCAVIL